MKKSVLSYLSLLAIVTSATLGAAIPTSLRIKKDEARISELEEKSPDRSYLFKVEEYVIATQTSEIQEITHDIKLAHCVLGANECYVEVPIDYENNNINLKYTGYIITYKIKYFNTVSNNGWTLA